MRSRSSLILCAMLASSCSSDSSAGLVLAEASVAAVFEAVLCRSEE